jgi:hypothetical protein
MKRMVLLILAVILLMDLAQDGCLGKITFCLPHSSAKTSVTSSHKHPGSSQGDFQHELAATNVPSSFHSGAAHSVTLYVPPTLQIMHCCHLSSSGGIPL